MIDVPDGHAIYYYHYDGLGSVIALSDVNGVLVEKYSYDVYGAVTIYDSNGVEISQSSIGNPFMFTGRRFDVETKLYYYRTRYYNPYIGRFMQTDPVGYAAGLNLYTYVRNNPVNYVDPSGEWIKGIFGTVIFGVGAGLSATGHPYIGVPIAGIGVGLIIWDITDGDIEKEGQKSLDSIKDSTDGWYDKDRDGFPDKLDKDLEKINKKNKDSK